MDEIKPSMPKRCPWRLRNEQNCDYIFHSLEDLLSHHYFHVEQEWLMTRSTSRDEGMETSSCANNIGNFNLEYSKFRGAFSVPCLWAECKYASFSSFCMHSHLKTHFRADSRDCQWKNCDFKIKHDYNRDYRFKGTFDRHMRVHSRYKLFACEICYKR